MSGSRQPGAPASRRILLGAAALLLAGLALPVRAQTGSLAVQVVSAEDGKPLSGATVLLTNAQGLVAATLLVTDAAGRAEFPVLRAGGLYALDVSLAGFAAHRMADLRIHANVSERLVVPLLAALEESVRVQARSDTIDLEETGAATRFDSAFVERLPVFERAYQRLLQLAPGVNDADGDGNPNVHGARSRDFKAVVGGVSNVDPLTGQWLSRVNIDSIEELEVITAGAGVEFGRAQGGFARVLQKQGSNDFEGVAAILYRSSELDGDGAANDVTLTPTDFETLQPSLQLSGPIVKDRLWYRLSHELIRQDDPVNTLNAIFVRNRRQNVASDQLTWQVSPRNKLALQYQFDPLTITNEDLSTSTRPEASRTRRSGGPSYSLVWTAPVSSRLIVDSTAAYQDHRYDLLPSQPDEEQDCVLFDFYPALNHSQCFETTNNTKTGSFPLTSNDRRQRLTVRSDVTWFAGRVLGATHRLKAGFSVENERYFRHLERRADIEWERFFPIVGPPAVIGFADIVAHVPEVSAARALGTSWGFYVEDQIKPWNNLVLTAGVRWDREEISAIGHAPFNPAAETQDFFELIEVGFSPQTAISRAFTAFANAQDFETALAQTLGAPLVFSTASIYGFASKFRKSQDINIANVNLSPRLSVAWDPWSNGKTKIALSAGRYYDKIFLAVPLVELEPVRTVFSARAFSFFYTRDPLVIHTQLDAGNPTASTRVLHRGLNTPYQDEWTASFERSLWPESSAKLSFIRRKFRDQLQDVDINHVGNVVLNPFWGDILLVGNFNTAEYKAFVAEIVRRQSRGWQLNGSYTWSKSEGDAEDFDQLLGNLRTLLDSERSYLAFDQRHVVKLNAVTRIRSGLSLGTSARWESGLPYSITDKSEVVYRTNPAYDIGNPGTTTAFFYPSNRRNDERNASFWTFDVRLAQQVQLRGVGIELTAEIFNLLNDDTLIQRDRVRNVQSPFVGARRANLVDGTRRFGRQFQVGVRVAF